MSEIRAIPHRIVSRARGKPPPLIPARRAGRKMLRGEGRAGPPVPIPHLME